MIPALLMRTWGETFCVVITRENVEESKRSSSSGLGYELSSSAAERRTEVNGSRSRTARRMLAVGVLSTLMSFSVCSSVQTDLNIAATKEEMGVTYFRFLRHTRTKKPTPNLAITGAASVPRLLGEKGWTGWC